MSVSSRRPRVADDFEHDLRYRVSLREAWICVAYWAVFTAVMVGIAWGVAGHRDPADTTYVLGFPEWFFWSGIVAVAVFCVIPAVMIRVLFTDVDLEPRPDDSREVGR